MPLPRALALATLAATTVLIAPASAQHPGDDGLRREEVPMDSAPTIEPADVPMRMLVCQLKRATNIDPAREQSEADIVYQGDYALTLELPGVHVPEVAGTGTARPDRAPDPGYKVAADPDGLFREFPFKAFDRTADYWPRHVELAQTIMGKAFQFIILDAVPDQPERKSIFVSRAADAVAIDLSWVFRGSCLLRQASVERGGQTGGGVQRSR